MSKRSSSSSSDPLDERLDGLLRARASEEALARLLAMGEEYVDLVERAGGVGVVLLCVPTVLEPDAVWYEYSEHASLVQVLGMLAVASSAIVSQTSTVVEGVGEGDAEEDEGDS